MLGNVILALMRAGCFAGLRKELKMSILARVTAMAVTAAAALFVAQPSQAITPVVQPHSTIVDVANGDSLVATVARRGVYRGGRVYRGRAVYRGRGVYRGGVYRRGIYRRPGLWYGATAGYYAQQCGYYPYPPCATGYYGGVYPGRVYRGGVYRGRVAYGRAGVYRRSVYRGGRRVTHYRGVRRR